MAKFSLDISTAILVDASFKGRKNIRRIKMVLDTGATLTTIPYEVAIGIGIDPARSERRTEILTATTREVVPIVVIPRFSVFGFSLKNIEAICLDLQGMSQTSGLLGLNVLKEFDISLRFRSRILEITR